MELPLLVSSESWAKHHICPHLCLNEISICTLSTQHSFKKNRGKSFESFKLIKQKYDKIKTKKVEGHNSGLLSCYHRRRIVDLSRTSNHSTMTTPRFGNAARRSTPTSAGHDYERSTPLIPQHRSPWSRHRPPTLLALLSLLIRHRLQCVVPPHYMGGLGY
jgi:hypothetical protein